VAGLTRKQQAFVHEYLVDMNATQAAIRAGYGEKSARVTASKMLTNANIRSAIEEAWRDKIRRADITADDVLRLITRGAYADIRDFVNLSQPRMDIRSNEDTFDGQLVTEITEETRTVGEETVTTRKLKLVSKESMIGLLAKHFGLTDTKLNVNITTSLADVLSEAWNMEQGDKT
jgi:phage terminase small subunit